ncbi:hypothetical protein [Crocinitomix algicola]|uniref:hypothetical protein n=1 Tax=Crocinitomix algicola TaxID=1740263 RepID=UPI0008375B55|nr:hypothetical protein [Crocinitomix algicola]
MKEQELKELTDSELELELKRSKKVDVLQALIVGFMIGIIIYSVIANTWGLVTLIPLILIFKLTRDQSQTKVLQAEMERRR